MKIGTSLYVFEVILRSNTLKANYCYYIFCYYVNFFFREVWLNKQIILYILLSKNTNSFLIYRLFRTKSDYLYYIN